jgi:ABC-type sulfate transport system substrate-binding protein
MQRLVILNAPHPGTFLRELQHSASQKAASAYMNFLIRPDAEALLQEDDYRRLWEFFTNMMPQHAADPISFVSIADQSHANSPEYRSSADAPGTTFGQRYQQRKTFRPHWKRASK